MKNISEIKSTSECTSEETFTNIQTLSAMKDNYEMARKTLEESPKSVVLKPLMVGLKYFAGFYHVCSVLLGVITIILLSVITAGIDLTQEFENDTNLPFWLLGILTLIVFILLLAILIFIEMGKAMLAESIFKKVVKNLSVSPTNKISLITLVVLSILISAGGAALISYMNTSKSQKLKTEYSSEISGINSKYDQRISQNEKIVKELNSLAVDESKRRWGLTDSEQSTLANAQKEIVRLEKQKIADLESIEKNHLQISSQDKDYTFLTMVTTAIIVLLLELICVYAYFFKYQYASICEKEGVHFNILPTPTHENTVFNSQKSRGFNVVNGNGNELSVMEQQLYTLQNQIKNLSEKLNGDSLNRKEDKNDFNRNKIGFKREFSTTESFDKEVLEEKRIRQANYLKKHGVIVSYLESYPTNNLTIPKIAELCGVSKSTVDNVKRVFDNHFTKINTENF